jgi:hypothetical protein
MGKLHEIPGSGGRLKLSSSAMHVDIATLPAERLKPLPAAHQQLGIDALPGLVQFGPTPRRFAACLCGGKLVADGRRFPGLVREAYGQ